MNEDERKQYLVELGNRIKQLRLEREMSQEELALKSGYGSRSTINKIELGINDVPQSKIKAIAEALGVSVGKILCWEELDQTHPPEKVSKESSLVELLIEQHGKSTYEAFDLYIRLDIEDRAEIRGTMKQMLKEDKYSGKNESSEPKAM